MVAFCAYSAKSAPSKEVCESTKIQCLRTWEFNTSCIPYKPTAHGAPPYPPANLHLTDQREEELGPILKSRLVKSLS